jgi:hypothetical protein
MFSGLSSCVRLQTCLVALPCGRGSVTSDPKAKRKRMRPNLRYHIPNNFHHSDPAPSQITKFVSEIRRPTRHQVVCET